MREGWREEDPRESKRKERERENALLSRFSVSSSCSSLPIPASAGAGGAGREHDDFQVLSSSDHSDDLAGVMSGGVGEPEGVNAKDASAFMPSRPPAYFAYGHEQGHDVLPSLAHQTEQGPREQEDVREEGSKTRIGCHDEGSRRAWRSRRSRIGIKFIDPMNHTSGV